MKTLVMAEGTLTPDSSRTNKVYTFNLQQECSRLNIDFIYYPKVQESWEESKRLILDCFEEFAHEEKEQLAEEWEKYLPICNLLTVGIEDCSRFRGCAHRHSPKQHIFISSQSATPGFIPGELIRGLWKVTVSVHAIVTRNCHYKLRIWEGEECVNEMDSL